MEVFKPSLAPSFHAATRKSQARILWEVVCIDGVECICDSAEDAFKLLQEQCDEYLRIMIQIAAVAKVRP